MESFHIIFHWGSDIYAAYLPQTVVERVHKMIAAMNQIAKIFYRWETPQEKQRWKKHCRVLDINVIFLLVQVSQKFQYFYSPKMEMTTYLLKYMCVFYWCIKQPKKFLIDGFFYHNAQNKEMGIFFLIYSIWMFNLSNMTLEGA